MFICYEWTCKDNNKKYIGVTKQSLNRRWWEHCYSAERGSSQLFHKAIRKYGKDNFKGKILETANTKDEILRCESKYIVAHATLADAGGYNLTSGGEYPIISSELRRRLSEKALQRGPVSDKTKKKLSESLKGNTNKRGKKLSPETKSRISEARKGIKQSKETIKKRSGLNHFNAKRVSVGGTIYDTIKEAAETLKIALSTVYYRVHSKNETFAKYFIVESD